MHAIITTEIDNKIKVKIHLVKLGLVKKVGYMRMVTYSGLLFTKIQ